MEGHVSHFYTLVLVDGKDAKTRESVEAKVRELLAPYSEEVEAEEYLKRCYCIGGVARDAANVAADRVGTIDSYRAKYNAMPEKKRPTWKRFIAPHMKAYEAVMASHPDRLKPEPDCDTCNGSGQYKTTMNPRGYWDWWQIGGRWTGWLSKYDPAKDPRNIEICRLCSGTGVRRDRIAVNAGMDQEVIKKKGHARFGQKGTCNGCDGTGKSVKFSYVDHEGDVLPAARLLDIPTKKWTPRAMVTPDGEWIQRGTMGWWGMSFEDMKEKDWEAVAKDALETTLKKHPGCAAVVVDCHI